MKKSDFILLINPKPGIDWKYRRDDPIVGPPIGLLSIGSALQSSGFKVKLIDAAVEPNHLSMIRKEILDNPLFVGLSVMTPQVSSALEIADLIKGESPKIPVVWGGIHPSLYPEQTLKDRSVDIIVRGIGEETVVELSRKLNSSAGLDQIKGIGFKQNSELLFTPSRAFPVNMDTFPELDYELLRLEKYINRIYEEWSTRSVRTLMVYGSIGCPYKCRFCINSVVHNSRYVHKSAERILGEIELLINKYAVTHVNFRDEDFFVSKERLGKLLDGIKSRHLRFTWDANARANYFNSGYLSEEMLKRLQDCGCVRLGVGAESGSDRVLQMIRKEITVKQK